MHSQTSLPTVDQTTSAATEPARRLPRVWPAAVIVATYWIVSYVPVWIDARIFVRFFTAVGASAGLTLLFWTWWFTNRTIPVRDRLFAFGANIAGAVVAGLTCHKSVGPIGMMMFGVPAVFTVWAIWLHLARRSSPAIRGWGLAILLWLAWTSVTLVRIDGIDGDAKAAVSWRWKRTAEELYLAEKSKSAPVSTVALAADKNRPIETQPLETHSADAPPIDTLAPETPPLELQPGDWPGFRGPNRDSVVRGVKLATDWNASPPKVVWRHRVGPAWSSFVVVGDRLFTQEQRGEAEFVVCLTADTGQEIWAHENHERFFDGQAGAGPRATPTFDAGRLYTFGATGLLSCLDAASGHAIWSRDVTQDCDGKPPMWGYSSSPLVADGVVVVYAGGKEDRALLAYHADSGELAWKAATGEVSYSSAQLASIGGQEQILFLSERGLTSVVPESGKVLWIHEALREHIWRAVQPRLLGDSQVLIGSEDLGLVLVDVAQTAGAWSASQHWASNSIRPAYNDFVIHDGYAYGFDGAIFCCIDLASGARRWKAGRYGHGQVLLLADQPLLVVLGETGEAVLLAVRPDKHEELGRFQAIEGKTWNHPVIAHGRLFVRNAEEMACYALKLR